MTKYQFIEEPCEVKVSSTVLKTSGSREGLAEFNSDCGYKWGKLDLSVREIVCINCNSHHNRDGNAAKNIEKVGVGHIHDSKWAGRECKTEFSAVPVELSTHLEYKQLSLFDC